MNENRYQVIYKGEFLEGFEKQTVYRNVSKILAVSEKTAAKILNGKRFVLKKNMDEATARSQCVLLKQAGIRVALGVPPGESRASGSATPLSPPAAEPQVPQKFAKAGSETTVSSRTVEKPSRDASAAAPAEEPAPAKIPFEFKGNGSEYFRIWIVNMLLTILTLGIYSAWAKVRTKQYFYANTRLHGAAFEYLASPSKILKGRLIVGGALALTATLSAFFPFLEAFAALAFGFLFPWLIVRSLAFNAYNSAWRNIRFGFQASYGQAFKTYVFWPLLAMLTLGILSPHAFCRQKKFLVENSSYGKSPFSFAASVRDYYRIFMLASVAAILGLAMIGIASVFLGPLMLLVLPIYLYGYSLFSVKTGNLFYNSIRLDRHRMESAMKVKDYMLLLLTNGLATVLTLGLFHPWAKVRSMRYKVHHLSLIPAADLNSILAEKRKEVSAIGDATGDFFDFDIGL